MPGRAPRPIRPWRSLSRRPRVGISTLAEITWSRPLSEPLTREQLEVEALNLPREERARLLEVLLRSLEDESEIEEAWLAEIGRRSAELDSGEIEADPADAVFRQIETLLTE
jgi:putative addiction module component (TIGR02574 family)